MPWQTEGMLTLLSDSVPWHIEAGSKVICALCNGTVPQKCPYSMILAFHYPNTTFSRVQFVHD